MFLFCLLFLVFFFDCCITKDTQAEKLLDGDTKCGAKLGPVALQTWQDRCCGEGIHEVLGLLEKHVEDLMDEQEWEHDPVPICAGARIIITIMVQYALKFIVVVFCVLFVPGSCTGILAQ